MSASPTVAREPIHLEVVLLTSHVPATMGQPSLATIVFDDPPSGLVSNRQKGSVAPPGSTAPAPSMPVLWSDGIASNKESRATGLVTEPKLFETTTV